MLRKVEIFLSCDLKDLIIETPMTRPEYLIIHSKYFWSEIIELYNIDELIANDGYVYINISKFMYRLNQAAIASYRQLILHMGTHQYYLVPFTTVLWAHRTRKTNLSMC